MKTRGVSMKRRILVLLCLIMCMFSLAACGKKDELFTYDAGELQKNYTSVIETVVSMSSEEIEKYLEASDDEFTVSTLSAWAKTSEEVGGFVSLGEIEVTENKDNVTLKSVATFSKRTCTITMVFEKIKGVVQPTTTEFSAKYTMGETMMKAGQNTIMGMGIVFCVLILISLIIALFKFIPMLLSKPKKVETPVAAAPVAAPAPVVETVDESDDLELVAVIAAAIAAYEGEQSTDGFVVRSIRRRTSNNW